MKQSSGKLYIQTIIFVFGSAVLPCLAPAQAVSSDEIPPPPDDEIVEMSPFIVSTDRDSSWVASNSLIGNRTNEALANIPISVDAITSEFIEDMGVFTMEDAAMFVSNLLITDQLETQVAEGRVTYRGMVKPQDARMVSNSSRNFFPSFVQTDNYNVERLDFNKGSNALMFGDASPGGQTTVYTKRPRFRNFGKVYVQMSTFESYRAQIDLNYKLSQKIAARINLVDRRSRTYVDYAESNLQAMHGAIVFQPFKNTALRLEGETGLYRMGRGGNTVRIRNQTAPGRGFSTNNRWYYTSDGEIVHRTGSTPDAVDRLGTAGFLESLLEGQSVSVAKTERVGSVTLPTDERYSFSGFSKHVNFYGNNDYQNRPFTNVTAWLEQRIGDLYLEAAFNQQIQRQERNQSRFGTDISVDVSGRPYVQATLDRRFFGNKVKIGRISASYPFRFGKWMTQYVVANAEWLENTIYSFRENVSNHAAVEKSETALHANNQIQIRAYLDDPEFPAPSFFNRLQLGNLPVTSDFRAGYYSVTDANAPFIEKIYQNTLSASAAGSYFGGVVRTLVGIRADYAKRKYLSDQPTDSHGEAIFLGFPEKVPEAYKYDPIFDVTNKSYMAGTTVQIMDGLNLYGVYSDSFHYQRAVDFAGDAIGPITGSTKEVGIKGKFFNKLHVTIAAFDIKRENSLYRWTPDDLSESEINDLFNPNDLRPGDPGYFTVATGFNNEEHTVRSSQRSTGWETTIQLVRWKGLQARLTYSRLNVRVTRDMSKFREFYEAAVARTEAALAPEGDPTMAEDPVLLDTANNILLNNEGEAAKSGAHSSPNSVNWLIDYEFHKNTFLKGTRIAVYGNWRDKYNISYEGRAFRNGSYHPVGAYITHKRRIFGKYTTFRLAVKNIVDLENIGETYRLRGISNIDDQGVPYYTSSYVTPVTVDFSITVDF